MHFSKEQSRLLGRQAVGPVSLLLVVALALSTTVRVGRPATMDAGRQGALARATAVTPQAIARPVRRATTERPAGADRRPVEVARLLGAPGMAAGPRRGPEPLRESLLDLPPPAC